MATSPYVPPGAATAADSLTYVPTPAQQLMVRQMTPSDRDSSLHRNVSRSPPLHPSPKPSTAKLDKRSGRSEGHRRPTSHLTTKSSFDSVHFGPTMSLFFDMSTFNQSCMLSFHIVAAFMWPTFSLGSFPFLPSFSKTKAVLLPCPVHSFQLHSAWSSLLRSPRMATGPNSVSCNGTG